METGVKVVLGVDPAGGLSHAIMEHPLVAALWRAVRGQFGRLNGPRRRGEKLAEAQVWIGAQPTVGKREMLGQTTVIAGGLVSGDQAAWGQAMRFGGGEDLPSMPWYVMFMSPQDVARVQPYLVSMMDFVARVEPMETIVFTVDTQTAGHRGQGHPRVKMGCQSHVRPRT